MVSATHWRQSIGIGKPKTPFIYLTFFIDLIYFFHYFCSNYPDLQVYFDEYDSKTYTFLLHNEKSLNDELFIHPNFHIMASPQGSSQFLLTTKRLTKISTKFRPCQEYWPKACNEIFLYEKIKDKYNCIIPILNSGIDNPDTAGYPTCDNQLALSILNGEMDSPGCKGSIPCEYSEFYIDAEYPEPRYSEDTMFRFTIKDVQEHQESYITVDKQDLVTQIGGILGITIGWSFDAFLSVVPSLLEWSMAIARSY